MCRPCCWTTHPNTKETICNTTVTTDPTTPRCVATLPCKMSDLALISATSLINVDRAWHVTPKQPGLKSCQLCGLGCSSTDGLSMLTIHDSQPAKAGDRHRPSVFVSVTSRGTDPSPGEIDTLGFQFSPYDSLESVVFRDIISCPGVRGVLTIEGPK